MKLDAVVVPLTLSLRSFVVDRAAPKNEDDELDDHDGVSRVLVLLRRYPYIGDYNHVPCNQE